MQRKMSSTPFYCCLILSFTLVSPQTTIDQNVLLNIFGTPPTPAETSTQRLEDVTRRTTDSTTTFLDPTGQPCKCVPYYLCNSNLEGVDANNESVTGYGTLDIRFRDDDCQESTERCCTNPKSEDEFVPPPPPEQLKACGYRNPKGVDFQITGGDGFEALFGEFPWVVALISADNGSYIGVGVLIHPNVIMTGAHIAYRYAPYGGLRGRAGEWDTQTIKERLPHQERLVTEMYIHPDFHPKTLYYDIALLRVETPFELAEHINVICLPEQDASFDTSKDCIGNGWGKDVFGLQGRYAVILKHVTTDMVPNRRCNALLHNTRLGSRFKLHPSFVCAGGEEGKDLCQGDGGGPLACPIGDDRYKLAGLVAWGIGCAQKDVPAVYTRVAMFRNWVDNQMEDWGYQTTGYTV